MYISQKLQKENIAEYLLYMWQVEDLIRANGLDIDKLQESYLNRFKLEGKEADAQREWYENLIEMMRSEGVQEKGHLQINKSVITMLNDLHNELLKSPKHPYYSAAYYKALPYIVELRNRSNTRDECEIENCFDAMYGLMMLRLQGKPVSEDTKKAMEDISRFLAMLAEYYKKDKKGEVEF
ncbi:MAG: DUF4924 family protein [Bacteroidaceae bacterium]|jgi:hypothetical protein|nr:DUF4924 family protein [Bacteroidaceae bacterium]MBQ2198962.1 DUF4924 family protein [Bacteroidaceae bacterium]